MDEGTLQILFYVVIGLILVFFRSGKKKPATTTEPKKNQQTPISEGQPTLGELLKKLQQSGDDPQKNTDYMSSEIYSELSKNYYQSSKPSELVKDQHLAPFKKKKKHVLVEDLLSNQKNLRKAFLMGEIFKTKF